MEPTSLSIVPFLDSFNLMKWRWLALLSSVEYALLETPDHAFVKKGIFVALGYMPARMKLAS